MPDCQLLSVHDFWVTIVTPQFSKDIVGVFTTEVAEAGLDPQHLPGEAGPIRTLKVNIDCFGLVGDAASLVSADATVLRSVLLLAGATRDGEV